MTEVSEETKMNNISVINKLIDQGKISQQTLNKIVIVNKNNNAIFRGKYDVIVQKETNWYKIFIDFSDGKPAQDREFIKKEYNLYSTFSTSYSEKSSRLLKPIPRLSPLVEYPFFLIL